MHRGVVHLLVNLEWLVGLVGTLMKSPAVVGESNRVTDRVLGLGLSGDGRIR